MRHSILKPLILKLRTPTPRTLKPWLSVLAFAAMLAPAYTAAGVEAYSSNEGSYSVNFPVAPQETVREVGKDKLIAHVIRDGDVIYVAAHGDFTRAVKPETEMNANIENYTHEIHAKVTSRAQVTIPRGERELTGIQFSYDGEFQSGTGIVVVDGTSSYLVAASYLKPADDQQAVNAFINSFRLKPKQ